MHFSKLDIIVSPDDDCSFLDFGFDVYLVMARHTGDRAKLLPYTNFYVEVLTQFWIKLLHVEVLTKVWIKLLHVEVLTIFPDKTSTLTKSIKITPCRWSL